MSNSIRPLLGASAIAALLAAPALAQESGNTAPVLIDQIETGDLWSSMDVHVENTADHAASSATTVGNAGAALYRSGDLDYDASQAMSGDAGAEARLRGYAVSGSATTTATAYGNASNSGTWEGTSHSQTIQTMDGDTTARSDIELAGAGRIASATTAIANVAATGGEYGGLYAFQTQTSTGSVTAETDVDMCCNGESGAFATTAGGNAVSSSGYTTTAIQGAVQTTAPGETIQAVGDVYIQDGRNIVTATTASGNSYVLENQWGYASLGREGSELYQGNESEIDAQSWVTLTDWDGQAAVSAYGVGNSAVVSNVGSDTALHAIQSNFAPVGAQASFTGSSATGGVAQVSAVAIGNAATGILCDICGDGVLSGTVEQFSSGPVYATGTMQVGAGGTVVGSASAIGNSATFRTGGD